MPRGLMDAKISTTHTTWQLLNTVTRQLVTDPPTTIAVDADIMAELNKVHQAIAEVANVPGVHAVTIPNELVPVILDAVNAAAGSLHRWAHFLTL
jgi:hypothetical protein